MSEQVTTCPFNYNKGCVKGSCGCFDVQNGQCCFKTLAEAANIIVMVQTGTMPKPEKPEKPKREKESPRDDVQAGKGEGRSQPT